MRMFRANDRTFLYILSGHAASYLGTSRNTPIDGVPARSDKGNGRRQMNTSFPCRLTRDPEARQAGDKQVVSAGIAFDTGWGDHKKPTFCQLEAWGFAGENLLNACKGDLIALFYVEDCRDEYKSKEGEKKEKRYYKASASSRLYVIPKRSGVAASTGDEAPWERTNRGNDARPSQPSLPSSDEDDNLPF